MRSNLKTKVKAANIWPFALMYIKHVFSISLSLFSVKQQMDESTWRDWQHQNKNKKQDAASRKKALVCKETLKYIFLYMRGNDIMGVYVVGSAGSV